jgi:hypothetical protein
MATTVGSHSVSTFATPVNGGPLDANVVRGNDNTIRSAYVAHDADTGIHVQSSTLASRPSAGTAGRKWITADTGIFKLWYDDGTIWHEVGTSTIDVYVLAGEALVKGDIVKVTGYNVGNGAPVVAKVASASDVAFGIVNGTIMNGAVGYVTNTGLIIDLNTNSFAIGDILYPNTSGGLTTTKPTSGNYQPVAFVLRSNSNNGVLYVEFSAPRIVERSDNTVNTVVLRDASGNFSAGTITAGGLTSTGLVTFASLKGTGATTVTNILDEDNMASDSATALATQQSIKAYVDAQVATVDTLAEVLANGNTTGANNIIVTSGQKVTTNTIDETTSGSGVTIDSVLLKDDVVNATDIETGTISANDGTSSATIADSTGVMTIPSSVLTTTDINGGTVDGVTIGGASAGAATFTNVTASGTVNLTGATVSNGGSVTTIDINGGTIDGTTIGGAVAAAGTFTTINATAVNATTFDMTNLEVTNIKAKDGTASMTIADTTGNVAVSTAFAANGNVTLGDATSDTITVGGSFPTGTKLRTTQSVGNTLAVSAYDVDGTAYVDLVTATASNTPTLALTSTGVGSMNNIAIGGSTPAAGAFTTVDASGDVAVATNKFTVAAATGNTAVAGTLTAEGTLTSNGDTVLGNAATDTITATAQFVTGTQLKSAQSSGNTLALAAYDVDGTAYTSLVTLTAGNTPTLTMTSVGTGSLNNVTIGGSTAAAGTFTNLTAQTDLTIGTDVVLSRGAANRLDLASGDSLNVVSGDYQIGGTSVLSSNTLGSGVTASSLTSVGTLSSLTVSGDLTVDTSTLKVDSTNNRVGIGTASPQATLQVDGGTVTADTYFERISWTDSGGTRKGLLGFFSNSGADYRGFIGADNNGTMYLGAVGGGGIQFKGNGPSSTTQMTLDGSGNLGLGVTPPAWESGTQSLNIGSGTTLWNPGSGTTSRLVTNAFRPTGGSYTLRNNGAASMYEQSGNVHAWYNVASGSANDTFTFTQAMTLDASGNLGLGATSGLVSRIDFGTTAANTAQIIALYRSGNSRSGIGMDSVTAATRIYAPTNDPALIVGHVSNSDGSTFTERARITGDGFLLVGKNAVDDSVQGVEITNVGTTSFTRATNFVLNVNRTGNDGILVIFKQDTVQEGDISVSGSTVSYNGGHLARYSQTADGQRIELTKGTVMSNLDQMAVWIDPKTGEPQFNEQLNCMKVSDVEGDPNVAGVFVNWDNDDDTFTNDMNIAMTGDMIIRIAEGVTVQRGDLLMSAGDGTAKPQGDDIVRGKTIAKVTSNHVTCTYEDGSYCVPCVLMAC